jgi:outer membrane protein
MNSKKLTKGILVLAMLGASSVATANEAGDWLVRIGGSQVDPKSNNGDVVNVDADSSISATLSYMLTEHWAIDVLAAWPFEHDINLNGGPEVGSTKHLPPTVSVQYHFLPNADFQPYVGLGINYTTFFDEETTGPLAGSDLSLDDSWGVAAQVGIDWMLGDTWFFNLDARYIDIETDAFLDGAFLEKVEIDPMVYGAHIGFRF